MSEKYVEITTPVCRISYPKLFEAEAFNGGKEKYSATFIFEAGTDISKLREAAERARDAEWPRGAAKVEMPFNEGDEKAEKWGEAFKDAIYLKAKSGEEYPPKVFDQKRDLITDPDVIYPGCYVRALVDFKAYEYMGKKGVTTYLKAIQLIRKGERIGPDVRSAFEDVDIPEDDDAIFG